MKKTLALLFAFPLFAITLSGCATTAQTICARKAEAMAAAQATIDLLNQYCPAEMPVESGDNGGN